MLPTSCYCPSTALHGLTEEKSPRLIVLQQMSPLTTDECIILKQSTCQVLLLLVLQMLVGLSR